MANDGGAAAAAAPLTGGQTRARQVIFYGVFAVLWAVYASIVLTFALHRSDISGLNMSLIVASAPYILHDVPVLGELVPPLLAGIITATAPDRRRFGQFVLVLGLSLITYVLYLHMSLFFNDQGGIGYPGAVIDALANQNVPDPTNALNVLNSFASSVRNFAAFVFAGLIGIRFNPVGP